MSGVYKYDSESVAYCKVGKVDYPVLNIWNKEFHWDSYDSPDEYGDIYLVTDTGVPVSGYYWIFARVGFSATRYDTVPGHGYSHAAGEGSTLHGAQADGSNQHLLAVAESSWYEYDWTEAPAGFVFWFDSGLSITELKGGCALHIVGNTAEDRKVQLKVNIHDTFVSLSTNASETYLIVMFMSETAGT